MISLLDAALKGRGVYSVSEAARYAKMPVATVRSWFFPSPGRHGMRRGDIQEPERKALSFYDFVEALAVRALRVDHKVSLKAIRQAIEFAQQQYGVEHIFAREDHRTLLDPHGEMHIVLRGETNPIAISGKSSGQQSFQACVEMYMRDLKFSQDGLAELYTAFRFGEQSVIINPAFSFGEPVMKENGYPADVLWRAVIAEGSIERAAELYDASGASVEAAYRYCNGELGMAA